MTELKKREEIDDKYKWKLDKIYKNSSDFDKAFEDLKKEAPSLLNFAGKLSDKNNIIGYFKLSEKLGREAEKLYVYAHMKCDEDTQNQENQARMNKIDAYMAEYASYSAYFVPEILALKDGFIEDLIKNDKNLSELGRMFNCSANTISDIVNGKT